MLVETLSQGEGTHDKISGAEECEDSNWQGKRNIKKMQRVSI